ncbi:MAG TPA: hypothetical protein PKI61_02700 [bacterium]|nr:hypothetical protein [bacterium]HPT29568.1 hypothetical protein [bacterium]
MQTFDRDTTTVKIENAPDHFMDMTDWDVLEESLREVSQHGEALKRVSEAISGIIMNARVRALSQSEEELLEAKVIRLRKEAEKHFE